jgi:hypothetical protein
VERTGEAYEREADRIAEAVTHSPDPLPLRREPGGAPPGPRPSVVHEALRSPGEPLDAGTRALVERRLGHDFARVSIHTDARAAASADALNALAYTVGSDIVFGARRHEAGSARGRWLLVHELAHVVQQVGDQSQPGRPDERHSVLRAPVGLMLRQGPPSDEEERKKEEEARSSEKARQNEKAKQLTVKRHVEQQRRVAGFLDRARKVRPDPKKGLRDPDNLFRNSVELLDAGRLTLTILSPTHYSPDRHFDTRFRFDAQGTAQFGGDYPANPGLGGPGMVLVPNPGAGRIHVRQAPPAVQLQTLPRKTERVPGGKTGPPPGKTAPAPAKSTPAPGKTAPAPAVSLPAAPSAPGDVQIFTRGLDLNEADIINTFVHEAQHVADLSPRTGTLTSSADVLESYKSEFRAFWIQPPIPRPGGIGVSVIDRLPEPTGKASNAQKVTIPAGQKCGICPAPVPSARAGKAAYVNPSTGMQNPRQEEIFWYLLSKYPGQEYDCCYVYNQAFHDEVNRYAFPESLNLINSVRVMDLNLEVRALSPSMTREQLRGSRFVALLAKLEPLDWLFLNDPKLPKLFWDALKAAAPRYLLKALKRLANRGAKKALTLDEVKDELAK